jgi:hypothetical protein
VTREVKALKAYELDYWIGQVLMQPVRIGKSNQGEHLVCWQQDKAKQIYSPSTRWRQTARVLLRMAREGKIFIDHTGAMARVSFHVKRDDGFVHIYCAEHEASSSMALARCFLLWQYGDEVPRDLQID